MAYTPKGTPPEKTLVAFTHVPESPYILTIESALFLEARLWFSDDSCAIFFDLSAAVRTYHSSTLLWYNLGIISDYLYYGLGIDVPERTSICRGTFVSINVLLSEQLYRLHCAIVSKSENI